MEETSTTAKKVCVLYLFVSTSGTLLPISGNKLRGFSVYGSVWGGGGGGKLPNQQVYFHYRWPALCECMCGTAISNGIHVSRAKMASGL